MAEHSNKTAAKREKFTTPQKSKSKQKILVAVVSLALISFIAWSFIGPEKDVNATNGVGGTWYIGNSVDYGPTEVQQTEVQVTVENGKVKFSKEDIEKNKIVFAKYKKGDIEIPLTAFINTKGRVVAATSMCEPCRGQRFRVAVDQLVCNTCGTRWKLTSLKGLSGAPECYNFPPEELKYVEDGNFISLDEVQVANWKPRV